MLEDRSLLSVGNLDPLFGNTGMFITSALGDSAQANAVAVLRDNVDTTADPILIAGQANQHFFVARVDATGTLGGFGTNGIAYADFGVNDDAYTLQVRNNLVIAAGTTGVVGSRDLAIARFDRAGNLDTSFNGTGKVTLDLGGDDVLSAISVLADNSIIAVGTTTGRGGHDIFVARFSSNGADLGNTIIDINGGDDQANAVTVDTSGNIYVAGATTVAHANGTNRDFALVKLTAAGVLDTSFGAGGITTLDFGGSLPADVSGTPVANPSYDDVANAIALQGDKIVLAGRANNGRFDFLALARFNANGSLDTSFAPGQDSFGPSGTVTTAVGPASDVALALTVQPNGEFVVAGRSLRDEVHLDQSDIVEARYFATGVIDTTFGVDGRIITPLPGGSSEARAIDFDDNGTLVIAGDLRTSTFEHVAVLRQEADIRPIAQPNSFTIASDGFSDPVNIVPLDNDFDPDPFDKLTITSLFVPSDNVTVLPGTPVVLAEGSLSTDGTVVEFTPRNGFSGIFHFVYTDSDGWLTTTSTVDVNISVGPDLRGGDRDPTFGGADNRVVTQINFSPTTGAAAATLSNGDIAVAGTVTTRLANGSTPTDVGLAIYDSTGQLVASRVMDLGLGGAVNLNETVSAVVIQNVGGVDRIVVVGSVDRNSNIPNSPTANDFFAVRFMADATLDTSFGNNGVQTVDLGGDDQALGALVEPLAGQNDIVIGGITDSVNTPGGQDFALVRLNQDGSRDMTFGTSGVTTTDFRQVDVLRALALQGTKIIAVGSADFLATDPVKGRDIAIARYDSNGLLDTTFGNGGKVIQNFTKRDEALSVAVDPGTEDILVGGYVAIASTSATSRDMAIVRFTPDGTLETSWGTNGITTVDFAGQRDEVHGLVIQNGKIFAAGIASVNNPNSITPLENNDFGLAVLDLSSGAVLEKTATDFVGRNDQGLAVVPNGTGVIVVGTAFDKESVSGIGLIAYNDDATINTNFGGQIPGFGEVFRAPGVTTMPSQVQAVAVQSDGKIVAAGVASSQTNEDFALVRYNPDGSIDTTYGTNGTVLLDVSAAIGGNGDDQINDLLMLPDDEVLAGGTATLNGHKVFVIAEFKSDGTLDTSFGTNGISIADFGSDAEGLSLAVDYYGNIVLAGYATQNGQHVLALAQFDSDGILSGLGGSGMTTLDLGVNAEARGVVFQGEKITIAGVAGTEALLARFNSDGSLDTTFNAAGPMKGVEIIDVPGGADGANQIAVDQYGNLVIAGFATIETGDTAFLAGRFLADGTPDTSFGPEGTGLTVLREFGPGNDQATGLALESIDEADQDIVLVGSVNFSGQSAFGVARLTQDGLLDTTFGTNGLIRTFLTAGPAKALAVAQDEVNGNLIVAGSGVTTTGGPTRFAVFSYLGQAKGEFPPLTVDNTATTAEGVPVTIPVLQDDQDANGESLSIVPDSVRRTGGTLTGSIVINGTNLVYTPPTTGTGTETFTFMVTDGTDAVPSHVTITVVQPPNITAALGAQGVSIDSLKFLNLGGPMADGVFTRPIDGVDPGPNGFVQLTTGDVRVVGNGTLSGVDNGNILGGNQTGAFDATTVEVDLTVTAANANFLSLDFAFLTNEFPIDPARDSNDAFVAELYDTTTNAAPSGPSWTINPIDGAVIDPNNFAYDVTSPDLLPVSVRSHFFNDSRVETLTGTLYNAGTPFLRAGQEVTPGHTYRLFLSIFDGGDGQVDSAVFLNNLQAQHVTADPSTLKGAAEGPEAGNDFLALPNPKTGVPVNVPVLQNDLSFDGGPLQIIAVSGGTGGTPTITGPQTLSYTPGANFSGSDQFTYTVMDSRGLTSTATVSVNSLVNTVASGAAAPTQTTPVESTNFVSQGQLAKNAPGSSPSVFTLADYLSNPTGVPFTGTTFFDVFAPNSRASDRVDLYVNDPTGQGELFYFNGQSWQPVRSSGNQPPQRINGQLHFVLDAFSYPRVTFLFGTVFDVPVTTPSTTTTVSTSSASSTGQGATSSTVTLNSDVQLSLGLTSSQSTVVSSAESSTSLRQSVTTSDTSGTSSASAAGTTASGSGKKLDFDLPADVIWICELNPPVGELLLDQIQLDGQVDPDLLNKAVKPLPAIDSFDQKVVPVPETAPEEEQQESETLDWFFQETASDVAASFQLADATTSFQLAEVAASFQLAGVEDGTFPTCRHEEVPAWAWAALALGPLVPPRRRRQSRVTVSSISSSLR